MQEQVEKLYDGILTACIAARSNKASVRMLLDVDDLQSYLESAFSHYSGTLKSPFDFVQASFINSPIPPDFGGNILKLAINIMEVWQDRADPSSIFQALSFVIASCIMFETARRNIRGTSSLINVVTLMWSNILTSDQAMPNKYFQNTWSTSTLPSRISVTSTGLANSARWDHPIDVSTSEAATAAKVTNSKMERCSLLVTTSPTSPMRYIIASSEITYIVICSSC
jgi:hypothetical protein